jgi:hypothetical protein
VSDNSDLPWWPSKDHSGAWHRQTIWAERASDPSLFLWIRVAAMAFGKHTANGHAGFKPGELANLLGKPGKDDLWEQPTPQQLSNAIRQAKKAGWIAEESSSRCLRVPPGAVAGGLNGVHDPCGICDGKRTGRRR